MSGDHPSETSLYPQSIPSAALTSDRFKVLRPLGSGGMATVYEVLDQATGKHVALKRLHPDPDRARQRRMLTLFEREFYTLSQIAHPRVVAVYDYGVDSQGAYYTMELLDGGELHGMVPLAFPVVCRIGRDIGSALSLLHSRRLVYRDLNPRNVHCNAKGSAKLLDFGAVTSMGPSRQVVGTPGYCAPEVLDEQPLDARTDLFSLGATLYFALTGRHAYPAKTFEQLRSCWETIPTRPSELVQDVPAALDALVMDLLHLDPALRPANVAEVIEQLAAIDGTRTLDPLQITQSYLVTPTLVGREATLARVRGKLLRALRGYGSALTLSGGSGVGRTRLLGACSLEAKLLGALVLRADASDASEDYGVVRALGNALLAAAPELALRSAEASRALLGIAVPELLARPAPIERARFSDPNQERVQLMAALRGWFMAIAGVRPLALAVDDLHRIDEPSATLLALCAHDAAARKLVILTTRTSGASCSAPAALQLFDGAAASLALAPISEAQTAELLSSVFGHVPHVQDLARELHAIAAGNPRDTLQLAQALVDRGVARYVSGAWSLPVRLGDADLPADMAQALRAQVAALSGRARELGRLASLIRDRSVLLEECAALYPQARKHALAEALNELCLAQALELTPEGYSVAHDGFHAALQHDLAEAERKHLHRLAAQLFARRGDDEFRRALHLLRAGDDAEALDVLVPYSARSQMLTDASAEEYVKLVRALPEDWLEVYTRALEAAEQLARPAREALIMRERLSGLLNIMRVPVEDGRPQLAAAQRALTRASGLDDYLALDAGVKPDERLKKALALAQARFDASPEDERIAPPGEAMQRLVRSHIVVIGYAAVAQDHTLWASMAPLLPFAPLSAAVGYVVQFGDGVGARINGQHERAREIYAQLIAQSESSADAGATNTRMIVYGIMAALGMMEAGMGLPSALVWADKIEDDPLFRTTSLVIRMLHALWQGRVRDADQLKEESELLRVQTSPRRMSEGIHLIAEVCAHANSDDLTRLKHAIDEIRELAERHGGWLNVLEYAAGEYQRIRGDHALAAEHLRAALQGISAGAHQIWPHAAGALTRVLWARGELDEAIRFGSDSLHAAEAAQLGYLGNYIRMPLALALADAGRTAEAARHADEASARFVALGSSGLNLVLAYETRARVAVRADDRASYEQFARRCAEECRSAGSRVLRAKLERVQRSASRSTGATTNPELLMSTLTGTQLTSMLVGCDEPRARAERSLALLLKRSGVHEGYLFLMGEHGPQLVAQSGEREASAALCMLVAEFIDGELQERDLSTGSLEQDEVVHTGPISLGENGAQHRLVLLNHQEPEGFAITGAAALVVAPNTPFAHPGALAAHLSRLLFDAGDVTPVLGG